MTSYPTTTRKTTSSLSMQLRPQDNLLSGLAEISFAFSLGVLWSEYSILWTGCGPLHFSDFLERICYQGFFVVATVTIWNRLFLVSGSRGGSDLADTAQAYWGPLDESSLWQVRIAESATIMGMIGAIVTLGVQMAKGSPLDGLSGIDVDMCRAIQASSI